MKCLCVALALFSTASAGCPPDYSFNYVNRAHGFSLCLPAGVTKQSATGYPAGSILFTGFAVPPKTNLQSKQLVIVPGEYDMLKTATPFGHFSARNTTFERAKAADGSAGHSTMHIIYTWKHGKNALHFDFEDRSVNIYNFDLARRPAEYDRAAQIKATEQIMSTLQNCKAP